MPDQATINAIVHQIGLQQEVAKEDISTAPVAGDINSIVKQVAASPDKQVYGESILPKVSNTGQTLEPVPGYQSYVENTVKEHFQNGVGGLVQNFKSLTQLGFTNKSFEEFDKENQSLQTAINLTAKEDAINTHSYEAMHNAIAPLGQTVSNVVAESAPAIGLTGVGMTIGGGAALVAGAPVALPILAGGAVVAAALGAGQMLYDLRKHGADPNIARVGGLAAGAANAATMFIGGGAAGAAGQAAVKEGVRQVVKQMGKSMFINAEAMELNGLADAVIKYVGTLNGGTKKYTPKQIWEQMEQATASALIAAPTFTIGGAAVGFALRKALAPGLAHSDMIKNLVVKINQMNTEAEIKNAQELQEKFFGKPEEDRVAMLKGNVEQNKYIEKLQTKIQEQEAKITAHEAEKAKLPEAEKEVNSLKKQLDKQLAKVAKFENENPYAIETVKGKKTGVDNTEKLKASIEEATKESEALAKELQGAIEERNKLVNKISGNTVYSEINTLKTEMSKADIKATEELQNKQFLDEYTYQYNQKVAKENAIKAVEEAELKNKKLKDEAYIKTQVDKMATAMRVVQGAANKLAKGQEILTDISPDKARQELQRGLTKLASTMPWSRSAGYMNVTFGGRIKILLQDVPSELADPLVSMFDTGVAVDHYDAGHRIYNEKLYGHISEATGLTNDGVEHLAFKAPGDLLEGTFKGHNGADVEFKLSADDIISYLMWMKNKKARVGLRRGNNYTLKADLEAGADSTEKVFEDVLNQADENYTKALQGFTKYYEEMGTALKGSYETFNPGKKFELEENYGGGIVRDGYEEVKPKGLAPIIPGEEYTAPSENTEASAPGFLKEREASDLRLTPIGAFSNAGKRAKQQALYEAFTQPSKLWEAFVNNPDIKAAVKAKRFEHVWDAVVQGYDDTVHGIGKAQNAHAKILDTLLRMQVVHWFGLKPRQYFQHLTTIINFAQYKFKGKYIPPYKITAAMANVTGNWGQWAKEIMQWEEVKTRYSQSERLGAFTNEDASHPVLLKAQKLSTRFLVEGDKPVVIAGTKAVYDWVFEQTKDPVLAKAEAVKAYKNVLASGSMDQMSLMTKGQVWKLMTMGQQPKMRLAQHVLEARREAANFPTPENIGNAVRASVISQLSAFMFQIPNIAITAGTGVVAGAVFGSAAQKSYNEKTGQAWFRATQELRLGNMFPVLGWLATSSDTAIHNTIWNDKQKIWEFSIPVIQSAAKTQAFVSSMTSHTLGGKPWTPQDIMTTFLAAVQGPGALAPIPETPVHAGKDFTDAVYPNSDEGNSPQIAK